MLKYPRRNVMDPDFVPFRPAQVRHHRFCFCIPCRWGTWILSALAGVLSAMMAIASFLALWSDHHGRPWLIVLEVASALIWGALVVICGFGEFPEYTLLSAYLLTLRSPPSLGWVGTIEQKSSWVSLAGRSKACVQIGISPSGPDL